MLTWKNHSSLCKGNEQVGFSVGFPQRSSHKGVLVWLCWLGPQMRRQGAPDREGEEEVPYPKASLGRCDRSSEAICRTTASPWGLQSEVWGFSARLEVSLAAKGC